MNKLLPTFTRNSRNRSTVLFLRILIGMCTYLTALQTPLTASVITPRVTQLITQNNKEDTQTTNGQEKIQVTLNFELDPDQWLYADSVNVSVNHPDYTVNQWAFDTKPKNQYDPSRSSYHYVFLNKATLVATLTKNTTSPVAAAPAHLYVSYQYNTPDAPAHVIVPLNEALSASSTLPTRAITHEKREASPETLTPASTHSTTTNSCPPTTCPPQSTRCTQDPTQKECWSLSSITHSWSNGISKLIQQSDSLFLRLILVFLLGILLSLTPCIYPMIPITVGILQAHSGTSLLRNCLVSLSYTCGMATTFALFGLMASCVGPLCGKLLVHPAFVLVIVGLLVYLALSLFDLYDLYTPSFMKGGTSTFSNGSLLSAFLFGAASGTFASPCVSPGLGLLLTIVATLGNHFLGFLLLFAFGVGLSTPLLIVGTISGSINMMPRAGAWMVQIKKLFGFVLLAMCFYYLKNILPATLVMALFSLYLFGVALYLIYTAFYAYLSDGWKKGYLFLALVLMAWSTLLAVQTAQNYFFGTETHEQWLTNYEEALCQARAQNKLLFIDCWAQYCSICHAINATTLPEPQVARALDTMVVVKIDGTDESSQPYACIKERYKIAGFPTFIIVDPISGDERARFSSEIYNWPPAQLASTLTETANGYSATKNT